MNLEPIMIVVGAAVAVAIGGAVIIPRGIRAMRQQRLPQILQAYKVDALPDDAKKCCWIAVLVDDSPVPWGLNLYRSERGLCLKHEPVVKRWALAPPGIAVVPWSEVAPWTGRTRYPLFITRVVRFDSGSSIITYL